MSHTVELGFLFSCWYKVKALGSLTEKSRLQMLLLCTNTLIRVKRPHVLWDVEEMFKLLFCTLSMGWRYNQGLSRTPVALKIRMKHNMAKRRCRDRRLAGLNHPLNDSQLYTCSLHQA